MKTFFNIKYSSKINLGIIAFGAILVIYGIFTGPLGRKIPFIGNNIFAWQLEREAQKYPQGSIDRLRLEMLAKQKRGEKADSAIDLPGTITTPK